MADQIILTALRGLRLDETAAGASLQHARQSLQGAIAQLQAKGIPVIIFTECDRAEVEPVRTQLGLTAPFITESGSGIFTSVNHNPFAPILGEKEGDYYVETLGCPYVQARAGLRVIANMISHPLKGFGDFTVDQLKRSAKISEDAAHRAKAREFSELFMTPKAVDSETLREAVEEMGFGLVLRSPDESRFSELIGPGAGLEKALRVVIGAYQKQLLAGETLKVMGISHRADDLSRLAEASQSVDWTNVLISQEAPAPAGWLSAVTPFLT